MGLSSGCWSFDRRCWRSCYLSTLPELIARVAEKRANRGDATSGATFAFAQASFSRRSLTLLRPRGWENLREYLLRMDLRENLLRMDLREDLLRMDLREDLLRMNLRED